MGLMIVLIAGAELGWLDSLVTQPDGQHSTFFNVVVGIVGALVAGIVLNPLIGGTSIISGNLSASSLIVSVLGAAVLLAIVNLFHRGAAR